MSITEAVTIADAWAYTGGDECARFFTTCLHAARPAVSPTARVLEIGCAEFNWLTPAQQAWPQMSIRGIDVRTSKAPGAIVGDVLTYDCAPESLDWIVSISAIEHMGLGHYQDPVDADGDIRVLERAYHWLTPGGWLFFDVPWNAGEDAYEVFKTSHRIYDDAAVQARLCTQPWRLVWRGIAEKAHTDRLLSAPYARRRGGNDFYYVGFWWRKPEN